ncbi:MAG: flavin reductase family protein, partial [Mycobacteriaceae bacterium]
IRGPRNGFPFVGEGSALFIAGGIGITPILPMVRAAQKSGMDWRFIYAGRSKASMPFLDEIETWDSSRVLIHIDSEQGVISGADLLRSAPQDGAVYCCGPVPMLESIREEFSTCAATALLYERFSAAPVVDGKEFDIQLNSTGEILTVPAETSALEAIKKVKPAVAYSCQQGFCGTCRVKVLSGTPEHRENRLSPQEQENEMLICVSRSAGERLVIDL